MLVVGITGLAGSGKSTTAKSLVRDFGFVPVSFAQHFKIPLVVTGDVNEAQAFGLAVKSQVTRGMFQRAGTENGRDKFGDDYWIRHADADIFRLMMAGVRRVVIDDVRFANEAEWIELTYGGLVVKVIDRGGLSGTAAVHPSETEVSGIQADLEISTAMLSPYGVASVIVDHLKDVGDID